MANLTAKIPAKPNRFPGKFAIVPSDGSAPFIAPHAPKDVTYKANGVTWTQVSRPTLTPISTSGGIALKVFTVTLFLGSQDYEESIDDLLQRLEDMSNMTTNLEVEYEPRTAGYWNITALDYSSNLRQEITNVITRADVNIEFTQASNFDAKSIVASGVKVPNHVYIVQKGDTFSKIAIKFKKYGITKWQQIADYNKVNGISMSPKALKTGMKIKIPVIK